MSFGSFMGRLAALTGVHSRASANTAQEDTVHDPFSSTSGVGGIWGRIFGLGLNNKGHVHGNGLHWGMEDMLELRRALFWIAAIVVVLLIAAVTNPTEASFRTHLTEMSFRRHLADIRHPDSTSEDDTATTSSDIALPTAQAGMTITSGTETPPIAPFRFANHVAISLRTPPLFYKTLFFLSIALTSPLTPPTYLSDPPIGKKQPVPPRERTVLYVGYMGHWVVVGQVPRKVEWAWRLFTEGSKEKGRKKHALLDRSGISELRSIASKEDSAIGSKALVAIPPLLSGSKHLRRSDSSTTLGDHGTLPLHAHPAPIPVAPFVPESRRSSIVNLLPSQPSLNVSDANDAFSSPLITALKTDLASAQAALAEVKAQLHAHNESVSTAHSSLQITLDEVRTRRKEDDAERQELKSRTKAFEEQKRQAEASRRDAEKKLKAIETVRDGLETKIATALSEIKELKGLMDISTKALRTVQEEGAKYVFDTRETVEKKKEELEELEGDIGELDARNEELGRAIKEAEEKVEEAKRAGEEARKLGPEEEMMMMAAAYEAAAQEGYQGNNQSSHTVGHANAPHGGASHGFRDNRNSGGDQWAHQAAAYMAEAGMPHIDQNYSARPTHSTSFGQFAKAHKAVDDRRPADLFGFEDFGPGATHRRTTTPPASDSGSDIWGHDPGSPNGGISSSFSANLLPQGLFRSLEGDQTPLDASTEFDDESVSGALDEHMDIFDVDPLGSSVNVVPVASAVEHDGSGSEGSSEASGHEAGIEPEHAWRSPLPNPPTLNMAYGHPSGSERQLLPPTSHTPPATNAPHGNGPTLPGLPALSGSRRWHSGTSQSSENVNNIFGVSPSNDSLLLSTYEASPFAPSSTERQQLALKWGSLGKRWARNEPTTANSTQTATRSFSAADLGAGWFPGRMHKKDNSSSSNHASNANANANAEGLPRLTTTSSAPIPMETKDGKGDDQAPQQGSLGSSGSVEKKPFRFFSLRRPTSSGSVADRSGTSPNKD